MLQIKDYTEKIFKEVRLNTIPVRFVLYNTGQNKLAVLKAIKDVIGTDLKDTKDIIDEVVNNPIMFRKYMTIEEMDIFRNRLSLCSGAVYDFDDREKIRTKKLIQLGIGDKSDIAEELSEMSLDSLLMNGFNTDKLKQIFNKIYSELSEEKLREIYDNHKDYFI